MLIDEVNVTFEGGNGGDGKVGFFPGTKTGPSGGNGGNGGNVYIQATDDLTALNQFSHKKFLKAENGENGGANRMFGKNGQDLIIRLPVGSILTNQETGQIIELLTKDQTILICRGGQGGRGNYEFRSSTNTTPLYAEKGKEGTNRPFNINLKLLAEFGLIGLPNAGKSSLLNELTAADVKVANYAFTTLEPNLGVFAGHVIADIPGLIEGASSGKGLGTRFLKHIEKVKVLIHCISAESDDPFRDYNLIKKELGEFNKELLDKKEIILLTKVDLVDEKVLKEKIESLSKIQKEIIPISIHDFESIEQLKTELVSFI